MRRNRESGFSMVATVASLLVTAVLVAIVLGATLGSTHNGKTQLSTSPGVGSADNLVAQQTLNDVLTGTASAADAAGGLGSLTPAELAAADPSVTFVAGPSTNVTTVSVATSGAGTQSGVGGSVTLAVRAADGTCWLAWKGGTEAAWFGAQLDLASCTAPALPGPPSASPVSSTTIGWEQGSFPAVP